MVGLETQDSLRLQAGLLCQAVPSTPAGQAESVLHFVPHGPGAQALISLLKRIAHLPDASGGEKDHAGAGSDFVNVIPFADLAQERSLVRQDYHPLGQIVGTQDAWPGRCRSSSVIAPLDQTCPENRHRS
jgi:hypothetical protein